jgi:dipeptidyl aminopeptidase/acylaminoacyl peptidase
MKRTACAALVALATAAVAADAPLAYQQPPESIRAVLDAAPIPLRAIDPTGQTLAVIEVRRYPGIEDLSRPFLRLAGLRVDPAANGPHRIARIDRITLRALADPAAPERTVALPPGGSFYNFEFSPDGRRFLLRRRMPEATELWVGDSATGAINPVPGIALQNATGQAIDWLNPDSIFALTVSPSRGAPPEAKAPIGPVVRESYARKSQEPTYQDLLRTPHDEALFDYYMTAQLKRIDLGSGLQRDIGAPAAYYGVTVAGDGKHLLVERFARPYSYLVTYDDFAHDVEVADLEGRRVRSLGRVALRENVPVQGVIQGPRSHDASALADGSIFWLEALDEGDPRKKVPYRDRVMKLAPPYAGDPVEVVRVAQRIVNVSQAEDGRSIVIDYDRDRVWVRTLLVDPAKPGAEPVVLFDLSARDRYNNPGSPMTRVLSNGRRVAMVTGGQMLYAGAGATPSGDRPFLDRWSLADRTKTRLFQASETHFENVVRVLDAKGERFVTVRESMTEPPNLVLRDASGSAVALTRFADPTPQVRAIRRELVKFKRKDGVDQSFWLYTPADQKPGERRPAFLWAYPLEYTDPALAGQVSGSPNRFEQFAGSSQLFLALDGFVVLSDVTMPVVGEPEKVNDTFVEQITMNAEAAIAKAAEMGVVDPARVAVGGHSYGAFMAANLLAHTDLFKTGIARSGAYNRTLTPFGFQAERRTLWEARDAYVKLSPFLAADKLKEPILLIHGEVDDNSGTFPEQSDRMFAALAGTGGNVRFVKLPAEAHGYAARESVGHTLWEMDTWLRKYLGDPRAP